MLLVLYIVALFLCQCLRWMNRLQTMLSASLRPPRCAGRVIALLGQEDPHRELSKKRVNEIVLALIQDIHLLKPKASEGHETPVVLVCSCGPLPWNLFLCRVSLAFVWRSSANGIIHDMPNLSNIS